jgi:hypothetical protein
MMQQVCLTLLSQGINQDRVQQEISTQTQKNPFL